MKEQKKILYFLLIFTIIFQIASPAVFGATTSKINYLALGDSIAEGYGLNSKKTERYSALIANKKSFSETNKAVSGMTCKEFYEKISSDNSYKTAIQNADVITVSIGSNELLKTAVEVIKEATNVSSASTTEEAITKASQNFQNANITSKATMLSNLVNGFTSDETQKKLDAGVTQYSEYWEKSIPILKSSNATIVVTEFYNPYHSCTASNLLSTLGITNNSSGLGFIGNLPDLGNKDLGVLFETYISRMNNILTEESNNGQNYKIAKIKSTLDKHNPLGTPQYTNVNLTASNFSLDPHPNANGHEGIANIILPYLTNVKAKSSNTDDKQQTDNNQTDDKQNDNKQTDDNQTDDKQNDNRQTDDNQTDDKQNDNRQTDDNQSDDNQANIKQDDGEQSDNEQAIDEQDDSKKENKDGSSGTKTENSTYKGSASSNSTTLNNNSTSSKNDSSVADRKLPQTGITSISLVLVFAIMFIGIYSFIMYKKHKDVI